MLTSLIGLQQTADERGKSQRVGGRRVVSVAVLERGGREALGKKKKKNL